MKRISISGPVAAGKTTLLGALLRELGSRAKAHEELPDRNPFIRRYYENSVRWSFHSQVAFLSMYLDNPDWEKDDRDFYFFDRCLVENLVIAKYRLLQGDLDEDEFSVLTRLALGMERLMPPIDKYVCLRCSPQLLLAHLRRRGRDYEQSLDLAYCRQMNRLYEEWYGTLPPDRTLFLSADEGYSAEEVLSFLES